MLFVALEFCDFEVIFAFTLFPSFLYEKESLFKHLLTWYFSCSWALRFVVFLCLFFSLDFIILLAGGSVKYFWMFWTRWCWVDEGSFDSWGSFNAFLFSVSTRMNRHFPFCRYNMSMDSVFTNKEQRWQKYAPVADVLFRYKAGQIAHYMRLSLSMLSEGYLIGSICAYNASLKTKKSTIEDRGWEITRRSFDHNVLFVLSSTIFTPSQLRSKM